MFGVKYMFVQRVECYNVTAMTNLTELGYDEYSRES